MPRIVIVIAVLGLAVPAFAQPDQPDVLPKEFACMTTRMKAASKFWSAKLKCASKCLYYFWKGLGPESDCLPPYGGATALCVNDTILQTKGAENKLEASVQKACVTGPGADCPECYAEGCGSSQSQDFVQDQEGQCDSFVPGLFCERAGALPVEQKCQLKAAQVVAKYFAVRHKCYKACFVDERSGGDPAKCLPPVTAPKAIACLDLGRQKATVLIDKYCNDTIYPDSVPDCGYPDGTSWTHLIDLVVDGSIAPNYCASPSGAFVD